MARDGSGNYTRVEGPYVNGNVADAGDMNNELDDLGDAVSDSINIAGTKAFAANQPMGGFKLTGLAAGTTNGDSVRYEQLATSVAAYAQPLDATLTALAALSWSSGSPVVQFTAADTVSLTLTPSVSSISTSQGATATTPSATFVNTTDNANVRALRLEGDRATPAANDLVYASFFLSSSTGVQREGGRISTQLWDVTNAAEYGAMLFGVMSAGTLTNFLYMNPFELSPNSNDGLPLGSTSRKWSDLFLATGAVLNFNSGNFTLTHVTGGIEASGTVRARVPLSSETGTPTSASANKKMVLTGGATINTGTADDFYLLDPGTSNRTITRGSGMTMYVNGTDSATATLAANQIGAVHYRSASVVVLTGAFS